MPDEPEALGLLALMLLTESRRAGAHRRRTATLVLLADQDRVAVGPRRSIAEGQALVRACLRRNRPGPYQIQAAIAAVHSDAATADGHRLARRSCALYDQLLRAWRRAASSRSTARSPWPRSTGRPRRSALVDALDLDDYHLFHAVRADLLARLGRDDEAAAAYTAALARTGNAAERSLLGARVAALTGVATDDAAPATG